MPSASTATPNGRPWAIRLSIEVSRTSTRRDNRIGSSRGNSSAISVRVAPADFPMPMARWPAERPMATTRYHRWVVMASVIRLLTSCTPTLLAVSKPKVGVPPGRGRSLSMVFGTCATRRLPLAAAASRDAENAVSSPPIVTSASIPSFRSDSRQACSLQSGSSAPGSRTVGLARAVLMIDPPWTWILDTSVMDSGRTSLIRPSMRCRKPSMIPTTSQPEFLASIVAAEMTEFIPGAGPPPHKIPSFTAPSFQQRGDPHNRVRMPWSPGDVQPLGQYHRVLDGGRVEDERRGRVQEERGLPGVPEDMRIVLWSMDGDLRNVGVLCRRARCTGGRGESCQGRRGAQADDGGRGHDGDVVLDGLGWHWPALRSGRGYCAAAQEFAAGPRAACRGSCRTLSFSAAIRKLWPAAQCTTTWSTGPSVLGSRKRSVISAG